jgi:choice-of-anchor A domain-containing protein
VRKLGFLTVALMAAATCAPAMATTAFTDAQYAKARAGISAMQKLNLLTLGNATISSDVEGKVYVGGNLGGSGTIDIGNSSKGFLAASNYRSLTVGGNLTGSINLNNGIGLSAIQAVVGGNVTGTVNINLGSASSANLQVGGTFNAQNFNPNSKKTASYGVSASGLQTQDKAYVTKNAALAAGGTSDVKAGIASVTATYQDDLTTLSQILGALTPTATLVSSDQNNIHFTFTDLANSSAYAVADITASQLASGTFVMPTYAATKTLIINVSGSSASIGVNATGSTSADQQNVIWNFTNASTVTVNTAIYGSVLAPTATVSGNSPINGSVVAQVFNSNGEVHLGTFSGTTGFLVTVPHGGGGNNGGVGTVPEPASWMTMILGFGFTGSIIRRQRRKERLAAA